MRESNHTPGPWRAKRHSGAQFVIQASGLDIAIVLSTLVAAGDTDEAAPNARLILAAPDMLRVLKLVSGAIAPGCEGTRDAVERIIAEAEGRL